MRWSAAPRPRGRPERHSAAALYFLAVLVQLFFVAALPPLLTPRAMSAFAAAPLAVVLRISPKQELVCYLGNLVGVNFSDLCQRM